MKETKEGKGKRASVTFDILEATQKHAFHRLQETLEHGPRQEVPTQREIECAAQLRPVMCKVCLLDGTWQLFPAHSHTTLGELKEMIVEEMGRLRLAIALLASRQEIFITVLMTSICWRRYHKRFGNRRRL